MGMVKMKAVKLIKDKKKLIYHELELLENFLERASETEIKESAAYIYSRVKYNVDKLKTSQDEYIMFRYHAVLKHVYFYLMDLKHDEKQIIWTEDGRGRICGLADKFRGIISLYSVAKELNINFKINWTYPIDLTNYLLPNKYDWIIDKKLLSSDKSDTKSLILGSKITSTEAFERIKTTLQNTNHIHVFTNMFINQDGFGELFKQLFQPTPELKSGIDHYLKEIGCSYISATFRFQQLLGDFIERESDPILPDSEKEVLINKCINHLINIYKENNYKKVLVTSDSITFLERVKIFDFVEIIPGKIAHIGFEPGWGKDVYMKSFLDYFVLTHSKCIYLVVEGQMYTSSFPFTASLYNNVPFILIKDNEKYSTKSSHKITKNQKVYDYRLSL